MIFKWKSIAFEGSERQTGQAIQRHTPKKSPAKNNDVYDVSTDDEVGNGTANGVAMETDDSGLPDLPDIFHRKKFFFYGKFSQSVRRRMLRFIIAYNGYVNNCYCVYSLHGAHCLNTRFWEMCCFCQNYRFTF